MAERNSVRRMGRPDGIRSPGHELTAEIPQAVNKERSSQKRNEGKRIPGHETGSPLGLRCDHQGKGLKKYWRRHEDFIKIRRFL